MATRQTTKDKNYLVLKPIGVITHYITPKQPHLLKRDVCHPGMLSTGTDIYAYVKKNHCSDIATIPFWQVLGASLWVHYAHVVQPGNYSLTSHENTAPKS